jgi:membrane peptidoglycan carboxypeptidase
MTLRNAFAHSVNTIAAQLGDEVGIPAVIETAKRMGVQSALPAVPSLALGSAEVTLMEMTRAFGSVAAGVQLIEPYSIRSVGGNSQQALYTKPAASTEVSGQLGANRAMMIDLLQAVVSDGTGKAARIPNVPIGGKTGTTQEYRDAWFIGFTPDITVGVWVGNDDNTPTNRVTGGEPPREHLARFCRSRACDRFQEARSDRQEEFRHIQSDQSCAELSKSGPSSLGQFRRGH